MPYQITRQSPDLLVAFMRGTMRRETIEAFLQDITQMLEEWPTPSDILIDGSEVQDTGYDMQHCLDRMLDNRYIRQIVCVVEKQQCMFSTCMARLAGEQRLFHTRREALDYIRRLRASSALKQRAVGEPLRNDRNDRNVHMLREFGVLVR